MAFQNIGFEEADSTDPGNALGWVYTFLAQAQLLADIDPVPDRPQEDFERAWGVDAAQVANWDITGALDGPYEITVNSNTALVNAVGLTATQIRDQLLALLILFSDPVSFAAGGGDDIDATADVAGEGFNFSHRQFINFEITGGTDGAYTLTILGQDHTVNAVSLTATQIRDQLLVLLLASNFDITFQNGAAGDSIDAIADVVGESFTFGSSSTGDPITTVVAINETLTTPNGLFRLFFDDSDLSQPLYDAIDVPPGELGGEDFEEGWSTNQGYLFELLNTVLAGYDNVSEPFEDFEDEWQGHQQQQRVRFTVTGSSDGNYTIFINTFPWVFTASLNSIEEIRDGLFDVLFPEEEPLEVRFVKEGTDSIVATSFETGLPFIHSTAGPDPITETILSSNVTYLFEFENLPTHLPSQLVAASYDTGTPETVEDFEEEWDSNESYHFTVATLTLFQATYNPERLPFALSAELFEDSIEDRVFTVNAAANRLVSNVHGLIDNEKLTLRSEGILPTELSPNLTYFARAVIANEFAVSKLSGGIPEALTDLGFGPHFFKVNPLAFWTLFMETI